MRAATLALLSCPTLAKVAGDHHRMSIQLSNQCPLGEAWSNMPKIIYLTGAPAAGKSSTMKRLSARMDLAVWEYGARLTEHCQRSRDVGSQDDLRAQSSGAVTPEDVDAVDLQLLDFVAEKRRTQHVLIDSHPVTKKRVLRFSGDRLLERAHHRAQA